MTNPKVPKWEEHTNKNKMVPTPQKIEKNTTKTTTKEQEFEVYVEKIREKLKLKKFLLF